MKYLKYALFIFLCSFIFISITNAKEAVPAELDGGTSTKATCTYMYSNAVNFVCNISEQGEATCNAQIANGANNVEGASSLKVTGGTFLMNGEISCKKLFVDGYIENGKLHYLGLNIVGGVCPLAKQYYEANPTPGVLVQNEAQCLGTTLVSGPDFIATPGNTDKPEEDDVPENDGNGTSSGKVDFNTETFCQRKEVSGAFKVIGWVIKIIKVVIPLIIIIFGSIDVAKAVISSKDDEIKKSIKSLVVRAIIGVLIFFVPTILNFAIKFIGGEDVYDKESGTFGFCTNCMLNPDDPECGNLLGRD